jgi:hypothetical protein
LIDHRSIVGDRAVGHNQLHGHPWSFGMGVIRRLGSRAGEYPRGSKYSHTVTQAYTYFGFNAKIFDEFLNLNVFVSSKLTKPWSESVAP